MADSNLEDRMSNAGDKDSPQMQSEEPVTLFYQGVVFAVGSVPRDKVQAALSMLGYEAPSGINQQGTYDFPVQEKGKESFPVQEEAALGMEPKKGKFADDVEVSSSVFAQTSCMQCGISSKFTMMHSGPETLCNACRLLSDSKLCKKEMADSDLEDRTSNAGDKDEDGGEEPTDSPQMQSEEPVTGGGGDEVTLFYQGVVFAVDSVPRDKVQAALSMLGYEAPSGINQQGTYDFPVQEKGKESFPVQEEAALGMQWKKGKFADDGEGSPLVSAQTACMQCGISSKFAMMHSGPETLCNACRLLSDSKENLMDFSKEVSVPDIQEPAAKETEQSDEEANESDASNNVGGK